MEPEDLSMEDMSIHDLKRVDDESLDSVAGSDPETSDTLPTLSSSPKPPSFPAPGNICPSSDDDDDDNNNRRVEKQLFPDDVLDLIFNYLSFEDLMSCARVCRQWRNALSASASRWRSLPVGLNFNLHGPVSSEFADNYFPKIEELKLAVSVSHVEFHVLETETRMTQPCLRLLEEVLRRGSRLKTLDVSKFMITTGLLLLQNVKQLFCTTHQ